jgi:hypothetical protein
VTGELCFDIENKQHPVSYKIKVPLTHELHESEPSPFQSLKAAKYALASAFSAGATYKVVQDNLILYEGDLVRV